jgi:hypothetical protein
MGKKLDLQVTINVKGKPRALFSVKDPPTGNMSLIRNGPDTFRPPGIYPDGIPGLSLQPIMGQRYSIHPSRENPDANTLKATTTVGSGEKIFHAYQHTKVIKSGQRFAFVYIQRCPKFNAKVAGVNYFFRPAILIVAGHQGNKDCEKY